MKKYLLAATILAASTLSASAETVTLQLKWVTQAQFAGYYVAQEKGYYKAAGLDVVIKPGGPDIAPEQVIAGQHCPTIQTFRLNAHLPQRNWHCQARRSQRQNLGRVVLWQ
jgi:NitT/TauT family transport system substrate-binding protein